jgi:MraZ protein
MGHSGGHVGFGGGEEVFLGEYTHTLDGKGRVVMPARFREELADGCIVLKGREGQVEIFPREVWNQRAAEMAEGLRKRKGRSVSRYFFASADEQQLDKAGRLLVKPDLRGFAGLSEGDEVVVVGVYDRVELWNPTVYAQERRKAEELLMEDEDLDESA